MRKITIVGDKIYSYGVEKELDDLFTKAFFKFSDSKAPKFNNSSFFTNELFLYFIQPFLAFEFYANSINVNVFELNKPSSKLKSICLDIGSKHKRKSVIRLIKNTFLRIGSHLVLFSTVPYLMYKMLRIKHSKQNSADFQTEEFSICRQGSSLMKIKKLNYFVEVENFSKKDSIYRLFPRRVRATWVLKSYFKSLRSRKEIFNFLKERIGENTANYSLKFYSIRLLHTHLYESLINEVFSQNKKKCFVTGNNLDRFALIEEIYAQKYNLDTICIPHGLEYGFRLPYGFTCNTFYAHSAVSSSFLNNLYNVQKFIFDEQIISAIFKIENASFNLSTTNKVVFFTEPREPEVNVKIISELQNLLREDEITLCLKLHPKDDIRRYAKFNLDIITDFNSAIYGNIVVARKSTVLLEGLYNNSLSVAILTCEKDRAIYSTFPSLNDERINVCYSIDELFKLIKTNINK